MTTTDVIRRSPTLPVLPSIESCRPLLMPRWKAAYPRFFDVYYMRFHDPAQRIAAWFRFVMFNSVLRPPELNIWATFYHMDDPSRNFLIRRRFPMEAVNIAGNTLNISVDSCGLTERRWWGHLGSQDANIRWNLTLEEGELSFVHLPRLFYGMDFISFKGLTPFSRARASGEITAGGETYRLDHVSANSAHYWGRRLDGARVWSYCNHFKEDQEFCFEGASTRASVLGIPLPRMTFLSFCYRGQLYRFTRPHQTLLAKTRHDLLRWQFEAATSNLKFVGEAAGRPERMIAHRFESTDGRPEHDQYVHMDSTADMRIEVHERQGAEWRHRETFTASRTAAFETSLAFRDKRVTWTAE